MTIIELDRILTPLRAAVEYGIAAQFAASSEERNRLVGLMLNRLNHAVENARKQEAHKPRLAA